MTEAGALHAALRDRLAVRPLVLLLDVDGTLSPIAPSPDAAFIPARTRSALERLVAAPGVHVALVSGRAAGDALRLVGVQGVWAVGNHGFECVAPDGRIVSAAIDESWRGRLAAAGAAAAPVVGAHPGAMLEDKRWTLSVHYRQAGIDAELSLRTALERIALDHGLALTSGRKVLELRPSVAVDKGSASLALVAQIAPEGKAAVLYAGDDRTDEDAFVALRAARSDAVTIRVAPPTSEAPAASAAEFVLSDVEAMGAFIELLAV